MNILIAIPCYSGMVMAETMMSLIRLNQLLNLKRIEHTISAHSDSLVTRGETHQKRLPPTMQVGLWDEGAQNEGGQLALTLCRELVSDSTFKRTGRIILPSV